MKFLRSYDGMVVLSWLCAIAFVSSSTEAGLSDSALAVRLAYGVMAVAVVLLALLLYLMRKTKRRAESKVSMSEPILLTDIQILAKSNSQLLEDALTLRSAQMQEGQNPGG